MRSTLINKQEKAREIKYPCLMITHTGGKIVLFNNECCGTVVCSGRKEQPIGYYSERWMMPNFTPFNGTIELSNN